MIYSSQVGVTRQLELSMQHYNEVKQVVRDTQKSFHKSLNDIPMEWKSVGLQLGRAFINVVNAIPSMLSFGRRFDGNSGK
jgi:hypothetical protein